MFESNHKLVPPPIVHTIPSDMLAHAIDHRLGSNIAIIGTDCRFHYVNRGFASSFSREPEALIGRPLVDVCTSEHYKGFVAYMDRALGGELVTYDRRLPVNGEDIWFTVSLTPWRNDDGVVVGLIAASMRVHELKLSSEALRVANERLSSHMENSPLAVIELDERLNIINCSARITAMLGLQQQAMLGKPLLEALGIVDTNAPLMSAFLRLASGVEASNRAASTLAHHDGRKVYCDWFNSALTDGHGRVRSIMCLVQDISEREEAAQQLLHVATHDPLTGLANRRSLTDRLSHSLARAKRTGEAVALLFIDLDGFKRVNDVYGHGAGDEVLKVVASRLRNVIREVDFIARIGGDEFVILMDINVAPGSSNALSERIFAWLSTPCQFTGGEAHIGASIGVAMHPPASNLAEDLIRQADAAMYEAKTSGKGCVRFAAP